MFQPIEEKEAERELIKNFANKLNAEVVKLQDDVDDGKTDGVIKINEKEINVEARRKGYPNHKGKSCSFSKGWDTGFLLKDNGIFLNESTIRNHKGKGFVFVVDIKGHKPRCCFINSARVEELLNSPSKIQESTNSRSKQAVKIVPLDWFKEY